MADRPDFRYEETLWRSGLRAVAGVDEAGRGPLAGPVVAAAVILPRDFSVEGIRDSKKLTPKRRDTLYLRIMENALSVGVGNVDVPDIDRLNILGATWLAMKQAIGRLKIRPQHVLIDGRPLPGNVYPQTALVGGDNLSLSVAAASIVAKVTRDRIMERLHPVFPEYNFRQHKGYGTRMHRDAIRELGPSPVHRKSFKGVKEYLQDIHRIRNRREIGRIGEMDAALYLHQKGYAILQRNFRAGKHGEIDIVMESENHTIFTEVKVRTSTTYGEAEYSVDERKQAQLGAIAQFYANQYPQTSKDYRFDVVTIRYGPQRAVIKHYRDAFRL